MKQCQHLIYPGCFAYVPEPPCIMRPCAIKYQDLSGCVSDMLLENDKVNSLSAGVNMFLMTQENILHSQRTGEYCPGSVHPLLVPVAAAWLTQKLA